MSSKTDPDAVNRTADGVGTGVFVYLGVGWGQSICSAYRVLYLRCLWYFLEMFKKQRILWVLWSGERSDLEIQV